MTLALIVSALFFYAACPIWPAGERLSQSAWRSCGQRRFLYGAGRHAGHRRHGRGGSGHRPGRCRGRVLDGRKRAGRHGAQVCGGHSFVQDAGEDRARLARGRDGAAGKDASSAAGAVLLCLLHDGGIWHRRAGARIQRGRSAAHGIRHPALAQRRAVHAGRGLGTLRQEQGGAAGQPDIDPAGGIVLYRAVPVDHLYPCPCAGNSMRADHA